MKIESAWIAGALCALLAAGCGGPDENARGAEETVEADYSAQGAYPQTAPPPEEYASAGYDPKVTAASATGATPSPAQPSQNHPAQAARGLPPGAIHLERAVVVDYSGFEQPMGAVTLFLPSGWRAQGGVVWGNQFMCTNGYNIDWSATSPDGATVAILPQDRWEANNIGSGPSSPGCRLANYQNVRDYLQDLAQRWRPGARVLDFRQRPDIAKDFAALNRTTPMPMGEIREWVEAGEVLFAYQENGRDMRGAISAAVLFNLMRTQDGMGGVMDALSAYAMPAWGATAPNGRLNFGFVEAIRKSIKTNPQWERRIGDHNNKIARTAIEEAGKRARITAQTNEEIARIRKETWDSYQESSDRRMREFSEAMRDVETYDDPMSATGQVELSSFYEHAWRLNDGSYVLTNDSSFNPYAATGQDGVRLEATP